MSIHLIVVENRRDWPAHFPPAMVVTVQDYLATPEYQKLRDVRVLNLCRGYRYLSLGYYCSLLAEARRHRVIPAMRAITDLSAKAIYSLGAEDLDAQVHRSLSRRIAREAGRSEFEMDIYFGRCADEALQDLAEEIFDLFPCPLLRVEFEHDSKWRISAIRPLSLGALPAEAHSLFVGAFEAYVSRRWRTPKVRESARYDIAILHDPAEKLPPTSARGLQRFIRAGKKLDLSVDLITRKDYGRLAEYDGLFIRETTAIDHHTYRFAKRAQAEGMAVIDDPESIVKCTNKVYLHELLSANRVPVPRSRVLQKGQLESLPADAVTYPAVVKIPDGSFSRGVHKADTREQLEQFARALLRESDLILLQEFVPTEFDWRIGVLNRRPIFACQYFMSKHHWQIVKHGDGGQFTEGGARTLAIEDAPAAVVKTALAAANLIGDGFYGVDIKQSGERVVVIEVNDNPNVDPGVEDAVLGDRLYELILEDLARRLDERRAR
ncbi:MAG: RimK family protein [Pseudomonadota bacterium]